MNIERIVSLAPSNTEIVFALGKGKKLVGVTKCCNYPPEVKLIEKIGGFSKPDIEKIGSLFPDLVLAATIDLRGAVARLRAKGITTYAVESKTVLNVPEAISFIGKLIDCQKKATELTAKIQERIKRIYQKTKNLKTRPKVCYICSHDPLCVALKSCTINKLIEVAGGINIMQDIALDNINNLLEVVFKKNPQVIITSKGHRESIDLLSYMRNQTGFKHTDAYLNNRFYQVNAELVCRPGPRAVQGLETLAKFIHPEIFC